MTCGLTDGSTEESTSAKPQQQANDADHDQQLEQRKSAHALTQLGERKAPNALNATPRGGRSSEVRCQTQCACLETVR